MFFECSPATPRLRPLAGPLTSSPIRERRRFAADESCQSQGMSLMFQDSSYTCFERNPLTGCSSPCRRSARLLDNGYYKLDENSINYDDQGNVTLTPDKTTVSYKERLVKIWRRRRTLLNMFRRQRPVPLAESSWVDNSDPSFVGDSDPSWLEDSATDLGATAPSLHSNFTYDHSEVITPPGKFTQENVTQEEICTETCHSQEQLTQSVSGLLDVPPHSSFHHCPAPEPPADLVTMKVLLMLFLFVFVSMVMLSRSLLLGVTVAGITCALLTARFLCSPGSMGRWRKAKTEDITSGNE